TTTLTSKLPATYFLPHWDKSRCNLLLNTSLMRMRRMAGADGRRPREVPRKFEAANSSTWSGVTSPSQPSPRTSATHSEAIPSKTARPVPTTALLRARARAGFWSQPRKRPPCSLAITSCRVKFAGEQKQQMLLIDEHAAPSAPIFRPLRRNSGHTGEGLGLDLTPVVTAEHQIPLGLLGEQNRQHAARLCPFLRCKFPRVIPARS